IHGTNVPSSIGHNASHGCIRMRNRDVEELFPMVGVGDRVELYAERNSELDRIFGRVLVAGAAAPVAAQVAAQAATEVASAGAVAVAVAAQ
ncbi:MAG TPA: L,D-transpeptidase, partial [Candidatus Acidoferrales bacterium]|nr:L,D-transpeptidase [Candidatus Acidoferrales bacterium]